MFCLVHNFYVRISYGERHEIDGNLKYFGMCLCTPLLIILFLWLAKYKAKMSSHLKRQLA